MSAEYTSQLPHGRWDIYGPIHKGLRLAATDLMIRLGRVDATDAGKLHGVLSDLRAHLSLAAKHLAHEEAHIHTALAARRSGAVERLSEQHADHRQAFERLEALIAAVESAAVSDRPHRTRELYLAYSLFMADDLAHMHEEESVTWPLLCALYSDEELAGIEMGIIGTLSPDENLSFMQLMIPAMTRQERIGLLSGMKANAPPEAFIAVIEGAARPTLDASDFEDLSAQLDFAA